MPRLSIVIPHRHHDPRLEATLLSVLENRPADCEVIVVHDGTYSDPYRLQDEVVFVEVDPGSQVIHLINAGIMAACSPIVHTLMDGVIVRAGWTQAPLDGFEDDSELAAIAVPIQFRGRARTFGVSTRAIACTNMLRSGKIYAETPLESACPQLESAFYRRKVMLALGGFDESLTTQAADVSFAWALQNLQLAVRCESQCMVHLDSKGGRVIALESLQQLASMAVAYGVTQGGTLRALAEVISGLFRGNLGKSLAWAKGLQTVPRHSLEVRLTLAKEELANRRQQDNSLRIFAGEKEQRRAA